MILIIDNGLGKDLTKMFRQAELASPHDAKKRLTKADAVVFSDCSKPDSSLESHNKAIVEELEIPAIGVGFGAEVMAKTFDCAVSEKASKSSRPLTVKCHSPLLLGLKKRFIVSGGNGRAVKKLAEDFEEIATSPSGVEIFQHIEFPLFGISFSPDSEEGTKMLENFASFVETWKKYH